MEKMLEPSLELFSKPYNDNLKYIEGEIGSKDYTYNIGLLSPLNEVCENLAQTAPIIFYEDIPFNKGNLSIFKSWCQNLTLDLTMKDFDDFQNVELSEDDPDDEPTALKLVNNTYDGVSYYSIYDTLQVPRSIYHYIEKHGHLTCQVTLYNYDRRIVDHKIFNQALTTCQIPELDFKYIPETIKYSKIGEHRTGHIRGKDGVLYFYYYFNLPKEYYTKCINIDCRTCCYNVNKGYFVGHSNTNQTKLNHLCYDIANNGLKSVIQIKLLNNGNSMVYFANKREFMAHYLGYPTLPAVVIMDGWNLPLYKNLWKLESHAELANQLFNPYFLIMNDAY